MFENQIQIKAKDKEIAQADKYLYLTKLYKFYWKYTHNIDFLYLYQLNKRESMKAIDFLRDKYLNKNNNSFFIDIANDLIIVKE